MNDKVKSDQKCIDCGELTVFLCDKCEEPLCEDCLPPVTAMGTIEKNLCSNCLTEIERHHEQ